ncbi:MAG: tetratricopeptide repeat protein, partial [Thermoleophilia bacterium]|nr:tetratricopeptide repeat protein [Thermoleophilia bacterium]
AAATAAADAAALGEADSLMNQGKIEEAVIEYQALLKTNPKNDAAQTQLGIAYAMMSNTKEEGEKQLTSATETNPSNAKAWTFLGMVRYDLARRQDATDYTAVEDALNKGIELDPNNARAYGFQAQVYAAQARWDEALTAANKAVDMAPDDVFTVSSLGYVYARRSEWDKAVPPYQKAVRLQPNWAWLQGLLAEGLQNTKNYTEALAVVEASLKLGQGYEARAYRRMGHIYWEKGDAAQAEAAFKKSLELDNTDAFAQWGLGGLWYEKGDYQNALSHLEAAATLSPKSAGYQAWLGACYKALNMYAEARGALERALQLDPKREDAREQLDALTAAGH